MSTTTIELTIRRRSDDSLGADARLSSSASAAPTVLAEDATIMLDPQALLAESLDPLDYGQLFAAQLFATPQLRDAWYRARAYAATGTLQLRLSLPRNDAPLHDLAWERLCDPDDGQPIALHERVRLVRTIASADLTPVIIPPRPELRALVVIANPSNLATYGLDEVDVEGEVARMRQALGDVPATILGDHPDAQGRASLANVISQLRQAPPLVFLVAHGIIRKDSPFLCLETEDGQADWVAGTTLTDAVARLETRPQLVVLAACRSAGSGYTATLRALAPALVSLGVPAIIGFQGDVAMSTVKVLLPTLIRELTHDGQLDRALAAARTALASERRPWWQAVLWLRTDGRLWVEEAAPDPRLATRETTLKALLHNHAGFIANCLEAFVGREQELTEIRARITGLLPSGGYVTITGQAGQGKSSIIARLVADALPIPADGDSADMQATLQRTRIGVPVCHFIPFTPGPDHQVGLLRNLLARLCLSYDLPAFYATSESRPAFLCSARMVSTPSAAALLIGA